MLLGALEGVVEGLLLGVVDGFVLGVVLGVSDGLVLGVVEGVGLNGSSGVLSLLVLLSEFTAFAVPKRT